MHVEVNFDLEDMIRYFERSSASEIYEKFYPYIHMRQYLESDIGSFIGEFGFLIKQELAYLFAKALNDTAENFLKSVSLEAYMEDREKLTTLWKLVLSDDPSLGDWKREKLKSFYYEVNEHTAFYWEVLDALGEKQEIFCIKSVGAPQYNKAAARIKAVVGPEAEPYLEEHKLLGEYRRTLTLVLWDVYTLSTEGCPDEIKGKVHRDVAGQISLEDFEDFIQWFKDNSENNQFNIDDALRKDLVTLYQRIDNLAKFYKNDREGPIRETDETYNRKRFFELLNARFQPQTVS